MLRRVSMCIPETCAYWKWREHGTLVSALQLKTEKLFLNGLLKDSPFYISDNGHTVRVSNLAAMGFEGCSDSI